MQVCLVCRCHTGGPYGRCDSTPGTIRTVPLKADVSIQDHDEVKGKLINDMATAFRHKTHIKNCYNPRDLKTQLNLKTTREYFISHNILRGALLEGKARIDC